ncbi:type IX secretion system protein PorG [Sphingobacterium griseoflavum]|uniref:DUF6089 domain-containing protein n=1 Tax=Sphingobacterium griseoflavum TaxID=1474952 RepID=A0ABQ3HTS1_9SPHI|nr:DUF6089 family protein [Sphingobacterium griseoflavum]GHE23192.1 hypothetical protein GCM10017764_01600 [Sphingobacterium griseoflavum]
MKRITHILFVVAAHAWSPLFCQQWEIGGHIAATGFMGDINPSNPWYFKSGGAGLQLTYNINPTWGVQAGYQMLHLQASDRDSKDPYRYNRGQKFNNIVHEASLRANFNFFRFIAGRAVNRYTPYLFAGIGGLLHEPYLYSTNGTRHRMEDLQLQQYATIRKFALAAPFGLGMKYNLKGPWSLGAELAYRVVFNDDLDNISNNYPTPGQYPAAYASSFPEMDRIWWESVAYPDPSNIAAYQGKAKGNNRSTDGYMTAGFTVTYTLISKRCYWWN